VIIGYIYIPLIQFPEFLGCMAASALTVLSCRVFLEGSAKTTFVRGAKLSLLYCCVGALAGCTFLARHSDTGAGEIGWLTALAGGFLLAAIYKPQTLFAGWVGGLAIAGAMLLIMKVAQVLVRHTAAQYGTHHRERTVRSKQRQFTLTAIVCGTAHVAIVLALANWLIQLFVNPDFPFREWTWSKLLTAR